MEHIDLDINNYSYKNLLDLYHIDDEILNDISMKNAYKITIMTHPDKSKLDKRFFLFFSKAYKLLKEVYNIQKKQFNMKNNISNPITYSDTYSSDSNLYNHQDTLYEKQIKNKLNQDTFSKWFNEAFENVYIKDKEHDDGYETWLKSDNELHKHVENINDMNTYIEKSKQKTRELIHIEDIETIDSIQQNGYNLVRDKPLHYTSGLFNKLQYEDLKKAHTETVIPVTNDDFRKQQYNNIDELMNERHSLKFDPSKHEKIYEDLQKKQDLENTERTYKLIKQMENTKHIQDKWWSSMKHLTL